MKSRTTLNVDKVLLSKAKKRAKSENRTLTEIIENALSEYLVESPRTAKKFRFKLITKKGKLNPSVDLDDRDSLFEEMEKN